MSTCKRIRIKLECLECGSIFNDDYRLQHERNKHDEKRVKIQHQGSPLNPFVASRSKSSNNVSTS